VLLTRLPLGSQLPKTPVRLACVRYAASVHPEPGSNSPFDSMLLSKINVDTSKPPNHFESTDAPLDSIAHFFHYSVVNVLSSKRADCTQERVCVKSAYFGPSSLSGPKTYREREFTQP
jgi:hypothetical protein